MLDENVNAPAPAVAAPPQPARRAPIPPPPPRQRRAQDHEHDSDGDSWDTESSGSSDHGDDGDDEDDDVVGNLVADLGGNNNDIPAIHEENDDIQLNMLLGFEGPILHFIENFGWVTLLVMLTLTLFVYLPFQIGDLSSAAVDIDYSLPFGAKIFAGYGVIAFASVIVYISKPAQSPLASWIWFLAKYLKVS